MMPDFDTDETEPKACITLRLGEIDRLLSALINHCDKPDFRAIERRLGVMRQALLRNAASNVSALTRD